MEVQFLLQDKRRLGAFFCFLTQVRRDSSVATIESRFDSGTASSFQRH